MIAVLPVDPLLILSLGLDHRGAPEFTLHWVGSHVVLAFLLRASAVPLYTLVRPRPGYSASAYVPKVLFALHISSVFVLEKHLADPGQSLFPRTLTRTDADERSYAVEQ